jgi:hypothetical protein
MNLLKFTQYLYRGKRLAVLGLFICAAVVPAMAAEEPTQDKPTQVELFNKDLKKVADLIHNMKVKIRTGATSFSISSTTGGSRTPGEACCSGNLRMIKSRFESMDATLDSIGGCYEKNGNRSGTQAIKLIRDDMKGLRQGLSLFRTTTERGTLGGLQAGLTRAYLVLLTSSKDLTDCTEKAAR